MPRWVLIIVSTMFVTFVTSSIYLRMKHAGSSSEGTFDGSRWRSLIKGRAAGVMFNQDRLLADLVVLPFAFVVVMVLVFIYDLVSPFFAAA